MHVDPSLIRPLRNVALVKLIDVEKVTTGGIHIPETAADRLKTEHKIGRVLAVGPGKVWDTGFRVAEVKVGDIAIFDPPYAAKVRGHDDLFLVEDDAILATIAE